ncbi:hypothetical protein NPX98_06565, partial [Bartonella sp. A5(2022)]|nr:hypothetical protein [Bartonella sp. A05]
MSKKNLLLCTVAGTLFFSCYSSTYANKPSATEPSSLQAQNNGRKPLTLHNIVSGAMVGQDDAQFYTKLQKDLDDAAKKVNISSLVTIRDYGKPTHAQALAKTLGNIAANAQFEQYNQAIKDQLNANNLMIKKNGSKFDVSKNLQSISSGDTQFGAALKRVMDKARQTIAESSSYKFSQEYKDAFDKELSSIEEETKKRQKEKNVEYQKIVQEIIDRSNAVDAVDVSLIAPRDLGNNNVEKSQVLHNIASGTMIGQENLQFNTELQNKLNEEKGKIDAVMVAAKAYGSEKHIKMLADTLGRIAVKAQVEQYNQEIEDQLEANKLIMAPDNSKVVSENLASIDPQNTKFNAALTRAVETVKETLTKADSHGWLETYKTVLNNEFDNIKKDVQEQHNEKNAEYKKRAEQIVSESNSVDNTRSTPETQNQSLNHNEVSQNSAPLDTKVAPSTTGAPRSSVVTQSRGVARSDAGSTRLVVYSSGNVRSNSLNSSSQSPSVSGTPETRSDTSGDSATVIPSTSDAAASPSGAQEQLQSQTSEATLADSVSSTSETSVLTVSPPSTSESQTSSSSPDVSAQTSQVTANSIPESSESSAPFNPEASLSPGTVINSSGGVARSDTVIHVYSVPSSLTVRDSNLSRSDSSTSGVYVASVARPSSGEDNTSVISSGSSVHSETQEQFQTSEDAVSSGDEDSSPVTIASVNADVAPSAPATATVTENSARSDSETEIQIPDQPRARILLAETPSSVSGSSSSENSVSRDQVAPVENYENINVQDKIQSLITRTSELQESRTAVIANNASKTTVKEGEVTEGNLAFLVKDGGKIEAANMQATATNVGLLSNVGVINLKGSTVTVTGDEEAYGIVLYKNKDKDVEQAAINRQSTNVIILADTKINVEDGVGIYGDFAQDTITLNNSEIIADILLKAKGDNASNGNSASSTLTINANNSTLEGGTRIAQDGKTIFNLSEDTTWVLKISKSEEQNGIDSDLDIEKSVQSKVSILNLSDSSIVFGEPTNDLYQILYIVGSEQSKIVNVNEQDEQTRRSRRRARSVEATPTAYAPQLQAASGSP